ncbi:hypothetical protein HELRODRAFT_164127 [Helobdella robusta]|uniref:RNase H type-1 domain-containing protein n=1 Tax=Helobdella robusta TaxID=6412 RepID=T1EUZ1_HELRO|nr:hypothetical protein HELRODRAFT_164127 [Helobdella robusta]ESN94311.1 hypothetical protein HELRODRAFT_164127 [Helobdella robusta]
MSFYEILEKHPNHIIIYTDGSRQKGSTSAAAVISSFKQTLLHRLPLYAWTFTAELIAINMALDHVKNSKTNQFLIVTDSLSSFTAINSDRNRNLLVTMIKNKIHNIMVKNNSIKLVWSPSHIGILSNEKADQAASLAHSLPISNIPIPMYKIRKVIGVKIAHLC